MESKNGSHEWEKGKWYSVDGKLKICKNGFHASEHIQDALRYVQGDTLAAVEVDGDHIKDDDKQCWRKMRVVETYDWSKVESLKLAIYSAKRLKKHFNGNEKIDEKIIEDCIDAAEKILNECENGREPSEKLLKASRSAAESAARSAAESATCSAAWLARSATKSASWSAEAARSACSAARSATKLAARSAKKSAVKKEIHEFCLKVVKEAER